MKKIINESEKENKLLKQKYESEQKINYNNITNINSLNTHISNLKSQIQTLSFNNSG